MLPNICRPCSSSIDYVGLVASLLTPHRFSGPCASLPRTCQLSGQQGGIHKAGHILRGCSQPPDLCKVSSEPLRNQSQNTKNRARSPDSLSSVHLQDNEARPEAGICSQLGPADGGHCSGHRAAGDAGDAAMPVAPGSAQGHPPRPPGAPPGVPRGPPPCPRGHAWNPGWGRSRAVGRGPRLSRGGAGGGAHLIAEDAVRLVAPGGHGRAEPGLAGGFQVEL